MKRQRKKSKKKRKIEGTRNRRKRKLNKSIRMERKNDYFKNSFQNVKLAVNLKSITKIIFIKLIANGYLKIYTSKNYFKSIQF